ncbi:MAG TPA: ankyrin repeat domain-containing protein [Gammaproteobacteria bacterium]
MKLAALVAVLLLASANALAADATLASLIQAGDREAALAAIRAGADVNAAQGDGTTPLHWAVYRIDPELAAELLRRGARADAINLYGSSPLAEAAKIGHAGLAEMLLDAGADVESPNQDGQTVLMLAARAGAADVAKLLVERGADVNAREAWRGQTALMWAADANAPEVVRLLIEHGADVEARAFANDWGVQITSEPRAQYRPTGGLTPLLYAARAGCTPCVAALLDAGADIDRPTPDGITPLMIALDNFWFDTAKLLLERGADPHLADWWGRTALYIAVDMSSYSGRRNDPAQLAPRTPAIEIVRMLLEAGVDPNPQLNMHRPGRGGNTSRFVDDLLTTGATPLLRAAIGHDVEAVRLLLEHGALVDLSNVMGVTPLMGAAGMGVSPRDRRLDFGGDVQARAIATIDVLLDAGADVNARVTDITSRTARIARSSTMTEREGQTALYGAVKFAWARVVRHLIDRGARVDVVDALGKSPLDAALGRVGGRDNTVSEEVAQILREALETGA